jgi:membrane protease YdiL (CAAX protease family)
LAVLTLAGVAASIMLGVWRRRSIVGPLRLRRQDARPVFLVLLGGMGMLFVSQILYLSARGVADTGQMDAADWAVLAVVPGVLVFTTLAVGNRVAGEELPLLLGYPTRRLLSGTLIGAAATVVVFPLMYWCLRLMKEVYRLVDYQHPQEHDLLRLMGEADNPLVMVALVVGAIAVAPLWEEFAFRGHLQSLLVGMFSRQVSRGERAATASADPQADGAVDAPQDPPAAIDEPVDASLPAWPRWLAVVTTSAAFAVIHPIWSAPAIFLLSLCLGYVYERSGNLWACVVLHALFNLSNTLIFLAAPA